MMTIIFSTTKRDNLLLYISRRFLRRYPSTHVAFGIQKDGQPVVFHMSLKGAVRTPRAKFLAKNHILKEYRIVPDLSEQLQKHLRYLGAPYDHMSAAWYYAGMVFRPLKQMLIFFQIRNGFFCANFARQLDAQDKIQSWRPIDKYWASVDDLQAACENSPEFEEIK
jgi:hypothetical protein